jgi:hypothetical protein
MYLAFCPWCGWEKRAAEIHLVETAARAHVERSGHGHVDLAEVKP